MSITTYKFEFRFFYILDDKEQTFDYNYIAEYHSSIKIDLDVWFSLIVDIYKVQFEKWVSFHKLNIEKYNFKVNILESNPYFYYIPCEEKIIKKLQYDDNIINPILETYI